jgi:hypothetical protein
MPHIDNLFQFIVPLTFLAIWALTSLFNREAPPLPQRMGRPQPPGGPGSGPGGAILRSEALNRDPSLRWAPPAASDRPVVRRHTGRPDDEILIIEEARRPAAQSPANTAATRPGAGGGTRRVSRPRPAAPPATKRPEPAAPRTLGGALTSSDAMTPMARHLDLNPLSLPVSPLQASDPRDLARTVSEPARQATRPALVWDDYKLLVSTPSKLREAVLVSEILQPPLSLRHRRPGG